MKGSATMTDINKEYEKEYYDEYRNNYYNPDDDNGEPGINLNWKRIQKGFHSVAANDQETAETLSGMQANLETLNTDVETLKTDVEEIKTDVDDLNTAVETAEQAAAAASASEAAAEAAQAAIEEIAESIPADYTTLSNKVTVLKSQLNNTSQVVYRTDISSTAGLIPFHAKNGDSITFKTKDGSNFIHNDQLVFYDASGVRIVYWAASPLTVNSRTFTYNNETEAFYIGLTKITTDVVDYIVVNANNSYNNEQRLTGIENNISRTDDALGKVTYQTVITRNDGLVPLRVNSGDVILLKSADGVAFSGDQLKFYDINKNYIVYRGALPVGNTERRFIYDDVHTAYYVAIDQVGGNNNAYLVVNESNINYKDIVPYADRPDITKYLNISKNDINSLKKNSSANFVFCSDLHAGETNLARIISFAESIGNVSAIVNGGDINNSLYGDSIAWYDTLASASTIPVLTCVGNHDVWSEFWVTADQKDVYNKFIAPVKTNVPAIVQPTDASTDGLNYYYFDIGNLRIIVLAAMITGNDTMYWNSDQKTWLESVLEDADTNNKSVICVNHSPFKKADAVIDYDSSLNTWVTYNSDIFDGIHLAPEAIAAVDDFIDGGGDFICWLTGHTHADYIMTETAAPGQLMISIASAKYSNHFDGYSPASETAISERNYDCFDLIGVDLTNKIIKVLRIGYNQDASMKVRNRYSYNYGSGKLVGIS